MSSDAHSPENIFPADVAGLLRVFVDGSFSVTRNHPSDYLKWVDFLIAVHRGGHEVSDGDFRRCLTNTPFEKPLNSAEVDMYVGQYLLSIDLLNRYDSIKSDET